MRYEPDPLRDGVAARIQAENDLYFATRYLFKERTGGKWQRAPHHKLICNALTKVFKGETTRLIINIPPRYSKTELVGVNFIPWCMGHFPDSEFIYASYAAKLAEEQSEKAMNLMRTPAYRMLFPKAILQTTTKEKWKTTAGGIVLAAGLEGTITGFGAGKMRDTFGGGIIIDDPHKPSEVESEKSRPKVIRWYQETIENRRNTGRTPIILIMQRLHEDDLAGWLLSGGTGEKWELLCLPAIQQDEQGNEFALWPEKHTLAELRRMQEAGPMTFAGQYQQRPAPPGGAIFRAGKIAVLPATPPKGVRQRVRGWDLGGTKGGGDYTVGLRMVQMQDGHWIVEDVRRLQGSPDEVEQAIRQCAETDPSNTKISAPQDPGQAGKAQALYLTKGLSGYRIEFTPESGDKVTRAEPFAAQVNVGNVSMIEGDWNTAFINELLNFPAGKYDDQVDAGARAFNSITGGSTYDLEQMMGMT